VREVFLRKLENPALARLEDAAFFTAAGQRLAFTTDCFVVEPLFFAGGDIGKLAVCGTVNDLLVSGARPLALSAGFILEEGLLFSDLDRIVSSMAQAAAQAEVQIIAGDTKVVPRGKADGCFITSAGVGISLPGVSVGADRARPGDVVLVSGSIGEHGAAILVSRAGIELSTPIVSDCAPLTRVILPLLEEPEGLHAMRDPTRGGLGTTLCELAEASRVSIFLEEEKVPIAEPVKAASELLGLDPFYLACEGRAIVIVAAEAAERVLQHLRATPGGEGAVAIGEVRAGKPGVICKTPIGGHRLVTMLAADPLPRIC
jgi:hydrogenase expression/formation protein HypE